MNDEMDRQAKMGVGILDDLLTEMRELYGEVAALGQVVQGRDSPEDRFFVGNEALQKKLKVAESKLANDKPGLAAASFLRGATTRRLLDPARWYAEYKEMC